MKNNLFINGVIKDGQIDYPVSINNKRLQNFLKEAPEGARVEIFISISDEKATTAQIARIHAMIRQLSSDVGYTFEEMKLQVKRKAGLCTISNEVSSCKSFAACDKDELNLAIQACIEIGDFNGVQLR